jgi:hypothetical protein
MKHNLTTHPSLAVELYTGRAAARQPVLPDSEDSFFLEQVTLTPTWMRSMNEKRIKKIKGKLLILNDKEISVNSTDIRIDKIIKIKIKDQSVQSGVFRIIGGLAMIPPGVILLFYAIYVAEEGPAIIGLPLLGIGIYQLIEGFKILKSNPEKIDQVVNRLSVVEIYPLVSQ